MLIPVPWVFVLTYLIGVAMEKSLRPGSTPQSAVSFTIGAVVFALGAVVAGSGWVAFRRARTTTIPGEKSSELVTWGPYQFSRNPMYVGLTLAYLGEALLLRQIWPVILLPLTLAYLNWVVIPVEEGKLAEVFSTRYTVYRARVRRWI